MGFAGELSTIGLSEVFQNIAFNRLTGTLAVASGEREASIHFEEGRIRLFSPGPGRSIDYAAVVARAGAVPPDTLEVALKKRRRRTLRSVLREAGGLDEAAYDGAVAAEVFEEIIPLFSWKRARFVFDEGRPDERIFDKEQRECSISIEPQAVAMEAARRIDEWAGIARHIASEREIFLPAGPPEGVQPDEEAQEILALLDGSRDVAGVVESLPHGKFRVMKAIARLVDEGLVVRATGEHLRGLAAQAAAGGDVNRAIRHLEAALEREGGDLETRRELARLYERAGKKEDAAREQKKLAFALQERGDLDGALEGYERASALLPYDTSTLEKIAEIHDSRGDRAQFLKAGRRLAEQLAAQALYDQALQVYKRLVNQEPSNAQFRATIATLYVKLHEPKKAAAELMELADECFARREYDDALHYYRNVVAVDRSNARAAERIRDIESGAVRRAQRARRQRLVLAAVSLVAALSTWQLAREWMAQNALGEAAKASAQGALFGRRPSSLFVLRAFGTVASDYPYTRAASWAREVSRNLVMEELLRIGAIAARDHEAAAREIRNLDAHSEQVCFPDDIRRIWTEGRDRILRSIDRITASEGRG
jgi:tetratricopeptide (TPR) repeat protein